MRGIIEGETYITRREPNHFMIKFQGFGISEDTLRILKRGNVKWIRIIYTGKDNKVTNYAVLLEDYLKSTKTHLYNGRTSGFKDDKQFFVSVKDMQELQVPQEMEVKKDEN
jgi:hypothetical protein|tara:strand:- start:59 stop:391 length:333 start_codon:yes stop_codon:yes gene_type:complete